MPHARWTAFAMLVVLVLALVMPVAAEQRIPGVVVAIVTDNKDPDGLFRVKVRFPTLPGRADEVWARVMVPFLTDSGFYALPEKDDEVLVMFVHGDFGRPVVLGGLWNGQTPTPQ